jgi:hypothetical protein
MKKYLITLSYLIFFSGSLIAETVRIKLYSRIKEKPEDNLGVLIFETKKLYQTDADGIFVGDIPSSGNYTIRILRPTGTQEIIATLQTGGDTNTIYTDKKALPKGVINVSGEKDKTVVSRYKVKYDEIKRMPGSFGEALRGLETLPGITPNIGFGGGANGIIIRGADAEWNTYLYDDLPINYPFHYDGLTSVVHNDMIKSIDVYTGAYPSNYANATGGIIEIETVDKVDRDNGTFQISLWNTTAMVQKQINNGKGYLIVGGKLGYLDRSIGALNLVPDGIRLPRYTDSQIKFVYDLTNEHQISIYNITAEDSFAAAFSEYRTSDPTDESSVFAGGNFSAGQRFRTTAFRHTWTPTDKFTNRLTLINYEPSANFNVGLGAIRGRAKEIVPYTGIRQDAVFDAAKFLDIDIGTEVRELSFRNFGEQILQSNPDNASPNPFNTNNPDFVSQPINLNTKSLYANAYTTFHLKFGDLEITPGARYDYLGISKEGVVAPKGTISYQFPEVGKGLTLFGGAGEYYRYSNGRGSSSFYNEDTGNPDLRFEKAVKTSAGIEQKITSSYLVKFEGFKNEFSNLVERDNFISRPVGLNPDRRFWLTEPLQFNQAKNFSNRGDGWSHGFEILLKKSNRPGTRDWFGWISYTWSQSFRNRNIFTTYDFDNTVRTADETRLLYAIYNNSKEQFASFDRTHIANIVYGWKFEEDKQIGLRWAYLTSTPITPIIGDDGGRFRNPTNNQIFFNPTYSNNPFSGDYGNSRRLNDYHRLDIRFDKFYNFEWGYINWYLEVVNVYLRKNVNGENFNNIKPFSINNPTPSETFGTLETPNGLILPFFNVGMEAKF